MNSKNTHTLNWISLWSGFAVQEEVEVSKRQNMGLLERERQLQLKLKSLQNCLKNEKEEVRWGNVH